MSEDDLAEGNAFCTEVIELAAQEGAETVRISAQVEAELVELGDEETADYLEGLGVTEGGLQSLIRATYRLLGLRTYFTTGERKQGPDVQGWDDRSAGRRGDPHRFRAGIIRVRPLVGRSCWKPDHWRKRATRAGCVVRKGVCGG